MGCSMHATAQALVCASVLAGDPDIAPDELRGRSTSGYTGGPSMPRQ